MNTSPRTLMALLLIAAGPVPVAAPRAQIVAPPLEKRVLEAGYAYKWFDREVDTAGKHLEWEAASVYARMGAWKRVTFVAEGGLWDVEGSDPTQTFSRWVIGGGLSARAWSHARWSIDAHVAYNEILDHDESDSRTDHRTYGLNAGLVANGSFHYRGQKADVFAGPMYVKDVAETYPYSGDDPIRAEPDRHLGACAGAYLTFFDYVSGFAYMLYLDEPQLRLGVSLRSKGEQP